MRFVAPVVVLVGCGSFGTSPASPTADAGSTDAGSTDALAPPPDANVSRGELYRRAVLEDQPLAYWRLADVLNVPGVASAATPDVPATFTKGTPALGGPGLFEGESGSFRFSGVKGMRLEAPASFPYLGDGPFTVEAWVKPTKDTHPISFLFHHSEVGATHSYAVYFAGPLVFAEVISAGREDTLSSKISTPAPTAGRWHHIVLTSPQLFYVDGIAVTTQIQQEIGKDAEAGGRLQIGARAGDIEGQDSSSIDGALTEVAVYARALSQARVTAHYALGKPE